jgi:secondary thiamine-phosphate synthase enzyme
MVIASTHRVRTKGQGDAHDVTSLVAAAIAGSRLTNGLATISVIGSTAGVTTIEFEPGAVADFDALLERLAPRRADYEHHRRWGDDNGSSHARAALVGPSVSIPFADGALLLGTWQQIALFEFDTRAREREIVVQVIGD